MTNYPQQARLTVRASKNALCFSVIDSNTECQVAYEPYNVKSGVSAAANLRLAFKESELLQREYRKARLLIDSPVMLVPVEEFDEKHMEQLYQYAFNTTKSDTIMHRVQPSLGVVALFPVNRDLKLVMEDNFSDVRFTPLLQPVWSYLHQRSFVGSNRKLYAYFHDGKVDIMAFEKNRVKFFNSYDVTHAKDAIYFILYIWKNLAMDQRKDELFFMGNIPEKDLFMDSIKRYVLKAFLLNPSAEFNRAPLTEVKNIPFDLLCLYLNK